MRARLAQLEALIADGAADEAVDLIRELLEEDGESLIALPPVGRAGALGFHRYWSVRRYLQMMLLQWSQTAPRVLKAYRRQVDSTARSWLEQAHADHDPRNLEPIVRDYLASSVGAQASWELGEAALQQGRYLAVLEHWQRLDPAARTPEGQLSWPALESLEDEPFRDALARLEQWEAGKRQWAVFASSGFALQRVRGRLALRALLAGQLRQARTLARITATTSPPTEETLWGKSAPWDRQLSELLTAAKNWPERRQQQWLTFGGAPTRAPRVPEFAWTGRLLWTRPVPPLNAERAVGSGPTVPVGTQWAQPVCYFPIGRRRQLWWAQPGGWRRTDLLTGRDSQASDGSGEIWAWQSRENLPVVLRRAQRYDGIPEFDLHCDGEFILGTSREWTFHEEENRVTRQTSQLTVWNARNDRLHWQVASEQGWIFSGPPVSGSGRVYVVERSVDQLLAAWRVSAFALQDGSLLWRRDLGRGRDSQCPLVWSNHRLTLIEDRLCLTTHAGIVACLDAERGTVHWILEYPRLTPPANRIDVVLPRHVFRRGTPPLAHGELLIVAPADSDRLFAVDILEGAVVWSTPPGVADDVIHLLGVVGSHAVVSGDRLYWVDVTSGEVHRAFPQGGGRLEGEALPQPRGIGRGLIAGRTVYWPTARRILRFDAADATLKDDPIELRLWGLSGGNLQWHRGVLVLASGARIAAFAAPATDAASSGGLRR